MTSEARIAANRRNAQHSTGPRTAEGKAKSRYNAVKHGLRSRSDDLVLPHEDPAELEAKIGRWVEQLAPRNEPERDLVEQAARLSWMLRRAQRHEAALLSRRVRKATEPGQAHSLEAAWALGRRLLLLPHPTSAYKPQPETADYPEVLVRRLEGSAEGCTWMLERWVELRDHLESGNRWTQSDMFKLVRLLGKQP